MASDLGLVAHPADTDPLELAAERPRDRTAQRGLADAGRPDEAQNRAARVRLEPADGQEFEDPVLDLLDVVVVLVEDLARVGQLEVVTGRLVPRERRDPLEISADHAPFGHRGLQPLEPCELAIGLLAHLLGQLDRRELLPELIDLGLHLVGLSELLLDRLELLAQEILPLPLLELRLDLRLNLRADRDDFEFPREHLGEPAQPLGHVDFFEELLLFLGLESQRPGDQMGENARILDVGDHDLQLFGEVGHLPDDVGERLLHVAGQRRQLGRWLDHVARFGDLRDQIRLGRDPVARFVPAGRPGSAPAGSRRARGSCARPLRGRRRR